MPISFDLVGLSAVALLVGTRSRGTRCRGTRGRQMSSQKRRWFRTSSPDRLGVPTAA